jgi:ribosomal protein S18 acetylase RimI-like enzyme
MTVEVVVTEAVASTELADIRPLVEAHVRFERSAAVVPPGWVGKVAGLVAGGRLAVFVARAEGEPVGYATVTTDVATWTAEPFAHLDCVYVAEGSRGAGVGGLLVAAVAEHARARGLTELQWQTPVWNDAAIRFYERLGAGRLPKERFTLPLN